MRKLLTTSLIAGIIALSSTDAAAGHLGWFVRVCPAKTEADRIHLTFSGGRQGFTWDLAAIISFSKWNLMITKTIKRIGTTPTIAPARARGDGSFRAG